jgi:hypothetical protein
VRSDRANTSIVRGRLAALAGLLLAGALAAVMVAGAEGRMQSTQLERHLCETKHGGKFVDIPGFPGEKIDRRLLADVRWLVRKYDIFITDGYALEGHARNGEHPIGLALDIVPDKAGGGSWRKITKLARWAEPEQDHPRPPFRWVGYNGDAGHGRGDHLHLSWMHSETGFNDPARLVYTRKCPYRRRDRGEPRDATGEEGPSDDGSSRDNEGSRPQSSGPGGVGARDDYTGDGGIESRKLAAGAPASGGIQARRLERRIARLQAAGPNHD